MRNTPDLALRPLAGLSVRIQFRASKAVNADVYASLRQSDALIPGSHLLFKGLLTNLEYSAVLQGLLLTYFALCNDRASGDNIPGICV